MNQDEPIKQLEEIRQIMQKSSRFLSLSGLTGVFAGIVALCGGAFAMWYLKQIDVSYYDAANTLSEKLTSKPVLVLIADALVVLFLAIGGGILFTARNSRRKGIPLWGYAARRMVINLILPLASGGLFCLILMYHGLFYLLAPVTLIFYGLALINASGYTYGEIRYLGLFEIILGLMSALFIGYGILFWMIGFGALHIVYGILMYKKYEQGISTE